MNNTEYVWSKIKHLAKVVEYPKKSTLLLAGDVCNKVYFIEKGVIRTWFNDDGNDVSFQFFLSGEAASSFESFKTGKPCLFNMETLSPSTLYEINKIDLFITLDKSSELKEKVNDIIFTRFYHYQKLFLSRITNTPLQRYYELLESSPEIIEQVPQHYIASYLGITSVSLSRIRNNK